MALTDTLTVVTGLRVGVVACGLVGTVTFFDRIEGGGGWVTGFSSSSGMSFRFNMEKYVLSIALQREVPSDNCLVYET